MRSKKERSKQGQTNKQTNKAKQHSSPKAVTFPRKNELPRVGLEPTTLYTLDRVLYQLSYRGSSAGWAQISHVHVYTHVGYIYTCMYTWTLFTALAYTYSIREMREERKKEASKIKQTNKAKQHSTHMYMYQRLFSSLTENEGAGGSMQYLYTCTHVQ